MEYRHLRFFIAVAEELHFTRAATRLRVAQPHLSQEIRRLEREVGTALFIRDRHRVVLTAAGRAFLAHARLILSGSAEAVRAAQRASRGETGRARIGFASSAGFGILPDAVRRSRLQYPDVELVLLECHSNEQIDLLSSGAIDVGLLHPPHSTEPALELETLLVTPLLVALPGGRPLAKHRDIALEALKDEPWIFFPRAVASRLYDEIIRACTEAGFAPRIAQEANKLSTIVSLVASGLGVSLVPMPLARLRLWRVVCSPLAASCPEIPLAIAWRRDDRNPVLGPLLETMRKEAQRFRTEYGQEEVQTESRTRAEGG